MTGQTMENGMPLPEREEAPPDDVLPIPDATGGWRDWVWERYGSQITDCVIRSRAAGKECSVSIDE